MRKWDAHEPKEWNMNECWNTCLLDHGKKLVVTCEWAFKISFCMESIWENVLCVCLISKSILHYQLLDPWQTVIAQLTCLNETLQEERCFYSLWSWPVILHDNACLHGMGSSSIYGVFTRDFSGHSLVLSHEMLLVWSINQPKIRIIILRLNT